MAFAQFVGSPNFQRIDQTVEVPDNDVAKCMYYLSCVCQMIDYDDDDMERYTDYENYRALSNQEDRMVFLFCLALSPDEFEDKVFFQNDAMCGSQSSNAFYKVTQVRQQLLVVQSIVIAGRSRQVKNIMTYKRSWMQNNYYGPMRRLAYRFSPQGQWEAAIRQAIVSEACIIS